MRRYFFILLAYVFVPAAAMIDALTPSSVWACACGCGIFEVGTAAMFPTRSGGMFFLEDDYINQNQNWRGNSKASANDNGDKRIQTNFLTAGVQYMFSRNWGIAAELPYWSRNFKTTSDDGDIVSFAHPAFGDMRVKGIYSGLSPDMSTGITFGLKLPTGDYAYPNFDRDTQIGTGSTDILLGAYHMDRITIAGNWNWFANSQFDLPALIAGGYRPGSEINATLGAYYDRWRISGLKIVPMAQAVGSHRRRDSGALADSADSGYDRIVLSPGIELDSFGYRIYGGFGFPVYQFFNGNQLAASTLFKLNVGYRFGSNGAGNAGRDAFVLGI